MLPAQGDPATNGGLEVEPEALADRLRRRVDALERQLEARIAEVDDLRARLAHHDRLLAEPRPVDARSPYELEILRAKAAEYDALMATFTMRALRLPRTWYGAVRRRLAGLSRR